MKKKNITVIITLILLVFSYTSNLDAKAVNKTNEAGIDTALGLFYNSLETKYYESITIPSTSDYKAYMNIFQDYFESDNGNIRTRKIENINGDTKSHLRAVAKRKHQSNSSLCNQRKSLL